LGVTVDVAGQGHDATHDGDGDVLMAYAGVTGEFGDDIETDGGIGSHGQAPSDESLRNSVRRGF